jgi:hypothetical protein
VTPDFTFNYGFRYEMSAAPYNHTGTAVFPDYANFLGPSTALFQPGVLNGVATPTEQRGKDAGGTDWFNPAPRLGFAWTPNFDDGILAKIFGKGQDSVIRGSYDITYYDEGTNMFSGTAATIPAVKASISRESASTGQPHAQSPLPPFTAFPLGTGRLESIRLHVWRDWHRDDARHAQDAVGRRGTSACSGRS